MFYFLTATRAVSASQDLSSKRVAWARYTEKSDGGDVLIFFDERKIIVLQNFSSKLVFSKTINDVTRLKRISYRQRWKLLILNKSVKNRRRCLRESAQIREQFLGSQRSRRCALYLASFITLRLTSVIRSYTLQFSGYNPSYLPRADS